MDRDELDSYVEQSQSLIDSSPQMDAEYVMRFYFTLILGSFLRVIDKAATQASDDEYADLLEVRQTLEQMFHDEMQAFVEELDYEPIPIQDLVSVQARAGLTCLAHVQERTDSDPSDD